MKAEPKVALLIDADNVSVDVMGQAVEALLAEYGAVHVRRAYGTAECAVKHQAVFKRLGIRPMVNLAAGKNSTDIAMAVDAIDLVLSERPDVVAIASSDSDFAPLVTKLREKGCRVVGLGQQGKTGDETIAVYDAFTVLAHRKAPARTARPAAAEAPAPAPKPAARAAKAERPAPVKKSTRRKPAAEAPAAPPPPPPLPEAVVGILAAMPELARGGTLELRVAAERLRDAGLITPRASPMKLLRQHAEHFELLPEAQPNQVKARGLALKAPATP